MILIPVFGVLLWKVKRGSDYKFVKNVVWLLLISNLSLIGFGIALIVWMRQGCSDAYANGMSILLSVTTAVQYISFNEAQWIFAHKYD